MWRAIMEFIHVAVAVLSLLSVGQSAPVTSCEGLIKPMGIQGREQLLGKWTLLAESTHLPGSKFLIQMIMGSAWIKITAANESDAMNFIQTPKMFGHCFGIMGKMTLENSALSVVQPFTSSVDLLNTGCPDCLVLYSKSTIGGRTLNGVQLLSRRNKVTAAELEEFTKQVECLNMPPPAFLDPENGVCPEESPVQQTYAAFLTNFLNSMAYDLFKKIEKIICSVGGMETLSQMISSGKAEVK